MVASPLMFRIPLSHTQLRNGAYVQSTVSRSLLKSALPPSCSVANEMLNNALSSRSRMVGSEVKIGTEPEFSTYVSMLLGKTIEEASSFISSIVTTTVAGADELVPSFTVSEILLEAPKGSWSLFTKYSD